MHVDRHEESSPRTRIALLLPERERFTRDGAGAVSLAVRDLAVAPPARGATGAGTPPRCDRLQLGSRAGPLPRRARSAGDAARRHDPPLPAARHDAPLRPPAERRREILFVGRLSPDKGADTFVHALALPRLPG